MQTYVVEARRTEDSPWMHVTSVQEDLVADVAARMPTEPGDWRLRPEGPEPEPWHPIAPKRKTVKITPWDRLKWWAMFRFAPKARH